VVPKRQRSGSTTIRNGTRGGTRTPLRVAAVVYDDTAVPGSGLSGERSHRTPAAVSAGSALVRVGYTAVAGSMLVSLGDAGLVGFPLFRCWRPSYSPVMWWCTGRPYSPAA